MLNDKNLRKYIIDNGETPAHDKYVIKDAGEGNFIARWEYDFDQPTDEELGTIQSDFDAELPMQDWKRNMTMTDKHMPRYTENIYDLLIAKKLITVDDLDDFIKTKYNEKKALRAQKP